MLSKTLSRNAVTQHRAKIIQIHFYFLTFLAFKLLERNQDLFFSLKPANFIKEKFLALLRNKMNLFVFPQVTHKYSSWFVSRSNHQGEEGKKIGIARNCRGLLQHVFSGHDQAIGHVDWQHLWLFAQNQDSLHSILNGEGSYKIPFLAKEILVIVGWWGKESQFFLRMLCWWIDLAPPDNLTPMGAQDMRSVLSRLKKRTRHWGRLIQWGLRDGRWGKREMKMI